MDIYINNKQQDVPEGSNISDMLQLLELTSQKGMAIAVNNNVVPQKEWAGYVLNEQDKMTLIKATQGG